MRVARDPARATIDMTSKLAFGLKTGTRGDKGKRSYGNSVLHALELKEIMEREGP